MERASEFVVPVKSWPAYVLVPLIPIMVVVYSGVAGLFMWAGTSTPIFWGVGAVIMFGALLQLSLAVKVARQAVQVIRYPPRLSPEGLQLWLFPRSEYVLVPWPRVIAVRTEVRGISRAFLVHVHDPEALAGGHPATTRRLRRLMRRFDGAPFIYAIKSSPERLRAIDQAVRNFSGDRVMLQG